MFLLDVSDSNYQWTLSNIFVESSLCLKKCFFAAIQPLRQHEWIYLFEEKNNVSFSKYFNFWVFSESKNFKLCRHPKQYFIIEVTLCCFFLWFLGSIKTKTSPNTNNKAIRNISNVFLVHFWRFENNFKPFYGFNKMTL